MRIVKRMKILITGNAGFVGREFMKQLDGHDITGIDIVNGIDARDFFAKDDTKFDLVIHLAAIVGGRATIEGNPLKVATDLAIDSDMFQWALRTRPGRTVYYSSSAAYPTAYQTHTMKYILNENHIDLDSIMSPDLTYGWAKLTGETLAKYASNEGLRVHVFRPFSGYGEDQDLDYPFPSFIARGKRKDNPFEIWGTGEQVRDFIHIEDVVSATLEAVNQNIQGPVNLGCGRATSFNELAELVSTEVGYTPEIKHILGAPEGVSYRVCDPSKLLTFYTPKISLEEGIRRAIRS
jgi:nucleoside-diphosphate-sugar epimerase